MKDQEYVKVGPLYKLTIGGERFFTPLEQKHIGLKVISLLVSSHSDT